MMADPTRQAAATAASLPGPTGDFVDTLVKVTRGMKDADLTESEVNAIRRLAPGGTLPVIRSLLENGIMPEARRRLPTPRWGDCMPGWLRLFALIGALVPAPAIACSEPSAPYCAESYGPFNDEYEFDSCRREMESYQSEVDDFTSCLRRELEEAQDDAERKSSDAISEYSDAVESFNRRASGY
jgi:hypothetical protein